MAIPAFNHSNVLPPHLGDPRQSSHVLPYPTNVLEVCEHFATNAKRIVILEGFLKFRAKLNLHGLNEGFQWLDGSFVEDKETDQGMEPNDLDIITFYYGRNVDFNEKLANAIPEFGNPLLAKQNFLLDHYPVDLLYKPDALVQQTSYWQQLFSHNRSGLWKGILRVELEYSLDQQAKQYLERL